MFRPSIITLSLNLTVQVHPMMSMVAYMEAAGPTAMRYLSIQQLTPQGYALL